MIFLSWDIAVGADRYLIEYSTDGRETWQPAGTGQSFINQHEFTAEVGLLTCRVAAVGAIRGEWADIQVNAGGDFDTPGKVQPVLVEPFTGDALKVRWDKQPAAARYVVRVFSRGSEVRSLYLDRSIITYDYFYTDAQQDAAGRTITIKVAAENGNGVFGDYGELTATNPPADVPSNLAVDSFVDSFVVHCSLPEDTDIESLSVWGSETKGFTPDTTNLLASSKTTRVNINQSGTWYFRVAWVDNWGADELNYSGEIKATSSMVDIGDWFPVTETNISDDAISTPKLQANAVEADKIAANAVTAEKINVNELSAVSAKYGRLYRRNVSHRCCGWSTGRDIQ